MNYNKLECKIMTSGILTLLLMITFTVSLSAQNWQWATHAGSLARGGNRDEKIKKIVADEHGNSYVLYYYSSDASPKLNNEPVNLPEHWYQCSPFLLLASYNCEGNLRWYKTIYSTYIDALFNIERFDKMTDHCCLEINANQLILGATSTNQIIHIRSNDGTDTLLLNSNTTSVDIVIGLDTNGNLLWNNSVKGKLYIPVPNSNVNNYWCNVYSVTVDNQDNIHILYAVGQMSQSTSCAFPIRDSCQLYVLKYNSNGEHLQTIPLSMTGYPTCHLLWINHKYYLSEDIQLNITINGDSIAADDMFAIRLVCYTDNGNFVFQKLLANKCPMYSMKKDNNSNIYITGSGVWVNNASLPGSSLPIVLKYDTLGNLLFYKFAEASGKCDDMTFLSNHTFAVVGSVGEEAQFDDIFSDDGFDRPFIAIVDEATGNFLHATTLPTSEGFSGSNGLNAVAADNKGNLIVGGYFNIQDIQVGDSLFTNYSYDYDMFVARYGWQCEQEANWNVVGIEEYPTQNKTEMPLLLYPNPTYNLLTIETGDNEIKEVVLINMMGKELQHFLVGTAPYTIDVSNLPAGMYVVKVIGKNKNFFGKFVKGNR